MNKVEVTAKQQNLIFAWHAFKEEHGIPPTHKELADSLGFKSANAVKEHYDKLIKKKVFTNNLGKARGMMLTKSGLEIVGVSEENDFISQRGKSLLSMFFKLDLDNQMKIEDEILQLQSAHQ